MKSIVETKNLLRKYTLPYRSLTPDEIAYLYILYNELTGKGEQDINCGECREDVFRFVYEKYKHLLDE